MMNRFKGGPTKTVVIDDEVYLIADESWMDPETLEDLQRVTGIFDDEILVSFDVVTENLPSEDGD